MTCRLIWQADVDGTCQTNTLMSKFHRPESPAKSHIRHRPILNAEDKTDMQTHKKSISSSLEGIHISPRTSMARSGRRASDAAERDAVELSLLSQEHDGADDNGVVFGGEHKKTKVLSVRDRKAMTLLIVLCPSPLFHLLFHKTYPL